MAAQEALELERAVVGQERALRMAAEQELQLHEAVLSEQRQESEKLETLELERSKLDKLDQ